MNKDIVILCFAWILTIVLLFVFVPKNKIRHAFVIFFFKQLMTWPFGLMVVEYKLIEYPVRLFKYASRASFTFEYFIYPALCVLFNLYYPNKKNLFSQFMHFFYYCTTITIIEVILGNYTELITYINWSWYLTWITLFITFLLSRLYYVWFFKLNKE